MTLKKYLSFMLISTFICWAIFAYIVFLIDPFQTNSIGFFLFYISLFFALSGTFAICGFLIRFVGLKRELEFYSVKTAFRQSFLFSLLFIIALLLESKKLLTKENLFLLIVVLSFIEYILLTLARMKIKRKY